jgi:hypothetical protein
MAGPWSETECKASCEGNNTMPPHTVGQKLDMQIAETRKHLEALCITKAKAEAMQMLDHPMDFIRQLIW